MVCSLAIRERLSRLAAAIDSLTFSRRCWLVSHLLAMIKQFDVYILITVCLHRVLLNPHSISLFHANGAVHPLGLYLPATFPGEYCPFQFGLPVDELDKISTSPATQKAHAVWVYLCSDVLTDVYLYILYMCI